MFCTRARSCARADDAKIVRSRNAQCKTRESHKRHCAIFPNEFMDVCKGHVL